MAAHDDPAAHRARGAATAIRSNTPIPATLAAAAAVLVGASAHQSVTLAYFAALAVFAVPVMLAAWPDVGDRDLSRLDAVLRRWARLARAGVDAARADVRRAARGNAALAPVYDRAEEGARAALAAVADGVGSLRRRAKAAWREREGAARAVCFVLRLVGVVVCTALTALVNAAYEEARVRAPAVLGHLRAVISEVRRKHGVGAAPSSSSSSVGLKYNDVAFLVHTAVLVGIIADVAVHTFDIMGPSLPIWFPCFVALCSTGVMVSEWAVPPEPGNARRRRVGGGEPTARAAAELKASWRFLWSLMVTAYFVDVYLLRAALGPRPLPVAFLAAFHVKIIDVGKEVQRAPEDGGAGKWRRAAVAVIAACVAKVVVFGVVLNVQLAALSIASLCVMTVLLLIREESLSDLVDASGGDNGGEEGAGFAGNTMGGAEEEEAHEVRSEHCNTSAEDQQEGSVLVEYSDSSEDHVHEERNEEQDRSSNSSMDSWDFVEDDPRAAD